MTKLRASTTSETIQYRWVGMVAHSPPVCQHTRRRRNWWRRDSRCLVLNVWISVKFESLEVESLASVWQSLISELWHRFDVCLWEVRSVQYCFLLLSFTCDCWNCELVFSPLYYDVRCIFLLEGLFWVYRELAMSLLRQLLFRLFRPELDLWLLSDRYADMSHAHSSDWGVEVSGINCWSKYRIVLLKCWWFYQNLNSKNEGWIFTERHVFFKLLSVKMIGRRKYLRIYGIIFK